MGMDLYKYKYEAERGICNNPIYLYDIDKADTVFNPDIIYEAGCNYDIYKLTKDLFDLDFCISGGFTWNLASDRKYIGHLKDEVINKLDILAEECRRLSEIDYNKFLESDCEYDLLIEKIENDPEKYTDKFSYLGEEDLKPYISEEFYAIKNKKVEIGYIRKPFRYFSTPSRRTIDKNGDTTVTCFIDNTTGVDEELYNEMQKHCYYDKEHCQMIFTSNTIQANELLEKCINPELPGVSELFPIKDNEIIEIDW